MPRILLLFFSLVLVSGCAAHSFPLSNRFVYVVDAADRAEVFADINGTLYPGGWQKYFNPRMSAKNPGEARWLAGSLLEQTSQRSKFRSLIERDTVRQLSEIKSFAATHKRIFILIHGFNSSVETSNIPFAAIEAQLDLKPGDGIIRLHWDGFIGRGIGTLSVWLKAANASQMVGSRGLRSILNQIHDREVYLIGHSRGASVALSALGNPIYNPKFFRTTTQRARLWGKAYQSILTPRPLADNDNRIHILMVAPAIDRNDFCDASEQPVTAKGFICTRFRPLGSQVKSFAYTVNSDDSILGKLFLSSRAFVPTGFGYNAQIGRDLKAEHYDVLREYAFEKPDDFHDFIKYVGHPTFQLMLRDAGIAKAPGSLGTIEPPVG